ncbi:hypothetical protein TanjilG_17505 [Lupinus angustifolius]|uniref:Pectinesterase inhibitor domain-containing protein n=2 Tax=Lupinus angustifolius TaxID=3871 RepID=A0A4P1R209_LUPAN|nr:hypothetical protein TanjilG_17505 [Lupinus angustifolius]
MCSSHNLLRISLSLIFISTLVHIASASNSTSTKSINNSYKRFIKVKCNSTTYPSYCYKSLSPYASTIKTNTLTLTKLSIHVALKAAKNVSLTLKKLSKAKGNLSHAETELIADCKENIGDSVDLLQQSADGLKDLNGTSTYEERFEWDTIKTWMSASITDVGTCSDEFDELKVRASIQKKIKPAIAHLAWFNSIALALVNRLSY